MNAAAREAAIARLQSSLDEAASPQDQGLVGELSQARHFAGFTDMLLEVCATLVRREERFAQTGAGWVLRELSLTEPDRVITFVEAHRDQLSTEALGRAVGRMPEEIVQRLGRRAS